jgi:hypothetical protein
MSEGSGCFFHDKMIAPVLLMGRGLLPPRKAKHGLGSCWSEPLSGLAGNNPASCREKNTPTPQKNNGFGFVP